LIKTFRHDGLARFFRSGSKAGILLKQADRLGGKASGNSACHVEGVLSVRRRLMSTLHPAFPRTGVMLGVVKESDQSPLGSPNDRRNTSTPCEGKTNERENTSGISRRRSLTAWSSASSARQRPEC
jgi:hypothetical protein